MSVPADQQEYPPVEHAFAHTQAELDRRTAAAHSRGWVQGATDVLDELDRARCFTTNRAKRTATRIRRRLEAEPR